MIRADWTAELEQEHATIRSRLARLVHNRAAIRHGFVPLDDNPFNEELEAIYRRQLRDVEQLLERSTR